MAAADAFSEEGEDHGLGGLARGLLGPPTGADPMVGRVEGDPEGASPLRSFVSGGAAVAGGGEGDWCLDEGGAQGMLRSYLAPGEGTGQSCHTQGEKTKDAPWGPHSALASGDGAGGGRGIRSLLLGTPTPGLQQTGSHCLHTAPRGRSPRPRQATPRHTLGHAKPRWATPSQAPALLPRGAPVPHACSPQALVASRLSRLK